MPHDGSSYWDYFDKIIKSTGSIECIIVIKRMSKTFENTHFWVALLVVPTQTRQLEFYINLKTLSNI